VEDLLKILDNLTVTHEQNLNRINNRNIMANPNYHLIRYQADNIPNFDGNCKHLSRFINSVENFLKNHQDTANVEAKINICLFDTIISKLVGRAADLIGSRIELNSWQQIKDALIVTFSDQRSEDCLVQDIICMKPDKNEPIQNFGLRLQDSRSLLFAKINSLNIDANIKLLKIQQYDDICLKTYVNNLNYHMQLVVRLKNPDSLEQAMSFVREEENFLTYRNRSNNTNSNKNMPTQAQKINKPFNNYQSNNTHYSANVPNLFRPISNFNPNTNPFFKPNNAFLPRPAFNPFQRYNNLPQQNMQRQFTPSARPFFNSNTNNNNYSTGAIPKNNFNNQRNVSEPMDTTSARNARVNSTQYRQTPKFATEELFNQSVNAQKNIVNKNDIVENTDNYNANSEYQDYYDPNTDYNPDFYYCDDTQEEYYNPYDNNAENDENFHVTPSTEKPT